ncbi:MAG: TetR/AcrR family transcriptional regulator [Deltaproteobacteria bacterium]|nr:TetR/AcrR family transcriptional regulator [Deltaproteobacteria bacterium]
MSVSIESTEPTSPTRSQASRRAETRRRLLEAATAVFAEEGLHAATSVAIAKRAGLGTGTFYLHFSDKHSLFEEIVDAALGELRERQERAVKAEPSRADDLRLLLEVLVDFTEDKRDLIRVAFERGGENAAVAGRIHDDVAGRVEATLRRHPELPIHPAAAAQARAATLIRVIAWWAEDPRRATREEIVETLFHLAPTRLVRAAASRAET